MLPIVKQILITPGDLITSIVYAGVTIIAIVAPLALIPFVFRWTGGILGAIGNAGTQWRAGAVQDRRRRSGEKAGKNRADTLHRARNREFFKQRGDAHGNRFQRFTHGLTARANRGVQMATRPASVLKRGRLQSDNEIFQHADEAAKDILSRTNNHYALNALARNGFTRAGKKRALAELEADYHKPGSEMADEEYRNAQAAIEILTASIPNGRGVHQVGAARAAASMGKLEPRTIQAMDHVIETPTLRRNEVSKLSQTAYNTAQWEYSRGSVGVDDETGMTYSVEHANGMTRDKIYDVLAHRDQHDSHTVKAAERGDVMIKQAENQLQKNVKTMGASQLYSMKSSSPRAVAKAIGANILEAHADLTKARDARDQAKAAGAAPEVLAAHEAQVAEKQKVVQHYAEQVAGVTGSAALYSDPAAKTTFDKEFADKLGLEVEGTTREHNPVKDAQGRLQTNLLEEGPERPKTLADLIAGSRAAFDPTMGSGQPGGPPAPAAETEQP